MRVLVEDALGAVEWAFSLPVGQEQTDQAAGQIGGYLVQSHPAA